MSIKFQAYRNMEINPIIWWYTHLFFIFSLFYICLRGKVVCLRMGSATLSQTVLMAFKLGAYFCYYAYVLRISRYSGFLRVVPTNTGLYFARFKTMRRKQNLAIALSIQKENFSEIL